MKVLITCGPTWMAIDQVRVISNTSSGEMGHLIAESFLKSKAQVTVIEGPVTHSWTSAKAKVLKYQFFHELKALFQSELKKKYDIVIHAAAVSDFEVKGHKGKMDSSKALKLNLVPTVKLIDFVKKISPESFLVGFKLEPGLNSGNAFKESRSLFSSGCDLVVANSIKPSYRAFVMDADGQIVMKTNHKKTLADHLIKILL
jgi:phosphopantothenoylcysteine synthetase/decarboxylase